MNNETTKKEPAKDHKKTYTVECWSDNQISLVSIWLYDLRTKDKPKNAELSQHRFTI